MEGKRWRERGGSGGQRERETERFGLCNLQMHLKMII